MNARGDTTRLDLPGGMGAVRDHGPGTIAGSRASGFTLVEVLVAGGVAVALLTVAFSGLFTGARSSTRGIEKLDEIARMSRLGEYLKKSLRFSTRVEHDRPAPGREEFRIRFVREVMPSEGGRVEKSAIYALLGEPGGPKDVVIDIDGQVQRMSFESLEITVGIDGSLVTVLLEGSGNRQLEVSVASPYLVSAAELAPDLITALGAGTGVPGLNFPAPGLSSPAPGGFPPPPGTAAGPLAGPPADLGTLGPGLAGGLPGLDEGGAVAGAVLPSDRTRMARTAKPGDESESGGGKSPETSGAQLPPGIPQTSLGGLVPGRRPGTWRIDPGLGRVIVKDPDGRIRVAPKPGESDPGIPAGAEQSPDTQDTRADRGPALSPAPKPPATLEPDPPAPEQGVTSSIAQAPSGSPPRRRAPPLSEEDRIKLERARELGLLGDQKPDPAALDGPPRAAEQLDLGLRDEGSADNPFP